MAENAATTVVVAAHLDDAVLSCAGALNPGVALVTVFAGDPPVGFLGSYDASTGARSSHDHMDERRLEDRAAAELLGAIPVHLAFPERQYQRRSGWKGLIKRGGAPIPTRDEIADALRAHLEQATRVYAPAGFGHNDHLIVRDAVLALRPDAVLYADLPYTLGAEPAAPPGITGRSVEVVTLNPDRAQAKVEAFACYGSQLDPLEAAFGDLLDPTRLGTERLFAAS